MDHSNRDMVWGGLAIAVWVLYQCVSGRCAYKGRGFRRQDNPVAFWAAMAFEALFSVACISSGLGGVAPAAVAYVLLVLAAVGFIVWAIRESLQVQRRYPRVFPLLKAGRYRGAAREVEAYLASHPDDRAAMWLLAGTYEKAGDRFAATEMCALLAQTDDQYGYQARAYLRRHNLRYNSAVGTVLDMPLGDVVRRFVRSIRGRGRS